MSQEDIRKKLDYYIKTKGTNYREVSLAIGRKDQYIHQFIKYGLPAELKEKDRIKIARFLDIDEQELTDFKTSRLALLSSDANSVSIDMLDATACCGNGLETLSESVVGKWLMPINEFKTISLSAPDNIKLLPVKGDSMQPTIKEGDWVFVDITRRTPDSDGMFLLRLSTGLAVKRIQGGLTNDIIIKSDNKKYNDLTASVGEVTILGKVIYILKAEKVG